MDEGSAEIRRRKAPDSWVTFFALWPDAATRASLSAFAREVAERSRTRPMAAERVHATLLYLGATPQERIEDLKQLAQSIAAEPFALTLDHLGWWSHNRIAWAGAKEIPRSLAQLQGELQAGCEKLGFSPDTRPYLPHITLARNTRVTHRTEAVPPLVWPIQSFCLVRSESAPARYTVIGEWPLTAGR